jgi:hypothetical protein
MSDMVIMPDETETCRVCGDTGKFRDSLKCATCKSDIDGRHISGLTSISLDIK